MTDSSTEIAKRLRGYGGSRLHNPWRGKGFIDEELAAMMKLHLDHLDARADVLAKDLDTALKPITIDSSPGPVATGAKSGA